mmetsp:Transcript_31259/g.79595  ORF Transcript_31259/g.79595 Transcript_31259/m.79595 type:complete len:305 (+) Transcript_31259:1315-2229(+)
MHGAADGPLLEEDLAGQVDALRGLRREFVQQDRGHAGEEGRLLQALAPAGLLAGRVPEGAGGGEHLRALRGEQPEAAVHGLEVQTLQEAGLGCDGLHRLEPDGLEAQHQGLAEGLALAEALDRHVAPRHVDGAILDYVHAPVVPRALQNGLVGDEHPVLQLRHEVVDELLAAAGSLEQLDARDRRLRERVAGVAAPHQLIHARQVHGLGELAQQPQEQHPRQHLHEAHRLRSHRGRARPAEAEEAELADADRSVRLRAVEGLDHLAPGLQGDAAAHEDVEVVASLALREDLLAGNVDPGQGVVL